MKMTKLPIPSSYVEKCKIETEKEVCILSFHLEDRMVRCVTHLRLLVDYLTVYTDGVKYAKNEINESNYLSIDHGKVVSAYLFQLENIAQLAGC